MSHLPINEWVELTPGVKELMKDFRTHISCSALKDLERNFAISLRQFLEEHPNYRPPVKKDFTPASRGAIKRGYEN